MTEPDEVLLASLEKKLQIIRDRVQGVAEGYSNGVYVWGEGGSSKSFTVEETLKEVGKPYKLSNTRVTARGLFELLRDFPDIIHVLEDVETLMADKNTYGLLRSALWGQSDAQGCQERTIVWQVFGRREEVSFSGGIILVANCALDNIPQLRALRTRIASLRYQPTNAEVAALMRRIACAGHRHGPHRLEPAACLEVAEAIIARSQRMQRNLDLRLLVNTFKDRLQYQNGAAETHWLDLLESRMKERALPGSETGLPTSDRLFLTEQCLTDPKAAPLRTADLYENYRAWCEAKGVEAVSPARLGRLVRQLFGLAESRAHRFPEGVAKAWLGLVLRNGQ